MSRIIIYSLLLAGVIGAAFYYVKLKKEDDAEAVWERNKAKAMEEYAEDMKAIRERRARGKVEE